MRTRGNGCASQWLTFNADVPALATKYQFWNKYVAIDVHILSSADSIPVIGPHFRIASAH